MPQKAKKSNVVDRMLGVSSELLTLAALISRAYPAVQPSPALVTKALEAKASVKRRNLRVDELSVREVSALGAAGTLSRSRFDRGAF